MLSFEEFKHQATLPVESEEQAIIEEAVEAAYNDLYNAYALYTVTMTIGPNEGTYLLSQAAREYKGYGHTLFMLHLALNPEIVAKRNARQSNAPICPRYYRRKNIFGRNIRTLRRKK